MKIDEMNKIVKYQSTREKKHMKHFIAVIFLIFSTNAFAMFCPTSFSQISIGDTLDRVIQTCGNPSSQNNYAKTIKLSDEWTYYVKTDFNNKTTAKMTVIFKNNKIININIISNKSNPEIYTAFLQTGSNSQYLNIGYNNATQEQHSVAVSNACGSIIKLGDSMQLVETACGQPITTKQNLDSRTPPVNITELKYGGSTPATLVFENGILKERV